MNRFGLTVLVATLALIGPVRAESVRDGYPHPTFAMPYAWEAPKVDGVVDAAEWQQALRVTALQGIPGRVNTRQTTFRDYQVLGKNGGHQIWTNIPFTLDEEACRKIVVGQRKGSNRYNFGVDLPASAVPYLEWKAISARFAPAVAYFGDQWKTTVSDGLAFDETLSDFIVYHMWNWAKNCGIDGVYIDNNRLRLAPISMPAVATGCLMAVSSRRTTCLRSASCTCGCGRHSWKRTVAASSSCTPRTTSSHRGWGHPAGVYNDSYLAPLGKKSTIEPVAAAELMGIRNMIFVRYGGNPHPPFEKYYEPFKRLDRVYWSRVGAGGATSEDERRHVIRLAEQNENIAGFILDDFFHARPQMWLAANYPRFPVTLTIKPPTVINCQHVELVQTDWRTGDYRSKDATVEISADGQQFTLAQEAELPNCSGSSLRIALPAGQFRAFRVRIRSTHDTKGAISCGLKSVRFLRDGQRVNLQNWQAEASSTCPGFSADGVFEDGVRYSASLSPEQLHTLGERRYRGKKLPITAVVYARQISPRLRPYLDEVDQVSLWTWRPKDLAHLERNLAALETLIPSKPVLLGCYMYDFDQRRPLPVERMKTQVEWGYRWLREGRIAGVIFLATPNVDVGLKSVEWTRQWIARVGDEGVD